MAAIVMNAPINSADTPEMIPFLQPNRIKRMIPPDNKSSSKAVLPPNIGVLLVNPGTGNERALITKYLSAKYFCTSSSVHPIVLWSHTFAHDDDC